MKDHRMASLGMARRRRIAAIACAALAAVLGMAVPARAEFGVTPGTFEAQLLDGASAPQTQAGSHPDRLVTSFEFETVLGPDTDFDGMPNEIPDEKVKDVVVELPPGLAGSANGAPVCSNEQFGSSTFALGGPCPPETVVGVAELTLGVLGPAVPLQFPVFNLEPGPDQAARFGWRVLFPPVNVLSSIRHESDYGLTSSILNTNQGAGLYASRLTLWGVPADHNASSDPAAPEFGQPGNGPRRWLLRLPTSCAGDLTVGLKVNSYEDPADVKEYTTPMPGPTGCDAVPFEPTVSVQPKSNRADSPSGYDIHIRLPQSDDPNQLGTADLKDSTVTLPAGVSISPSAGSGLAACTDAQFGAGTRGPVGCPNASKVGTVTVETPSLPRPLEGGLFLGQPQPGDTFRLFLHAERSGVVLRLKGSVAPDPNTGQLVTTFANNPQLPFSDLHLSFFGGSRATLANPAACGLHTATASLTSHAGHVRGASDSFVIGSGPDGGACGAPFAPTLSAGSMNPVAGAFSPFALRVDRGDGHQNLSGLTVDLPAGFSARVAGVPLCPDANAAAGTCGPESRMGSVVVGAGAGPTPVDVPGTAYLGGPYKGGQFSLVFVVPAVVGPFNLGTVVVRAAIVVDPRDAHLTVVSDPLPQIVGGVPLRMRSLTVRIDRPNTTVNPTSCAEKAVRASVGSAQGATAALSNRYQVGECAALRFRPRISARFIGRRQVRPGRHPGLRVRVRQARGQANLRNVAFTLPAGISLDIEALPDPCTRAQLASMSCPADSRVGSARAVTRVLSQPLSGPVYLVQGAGAGGLPALAAILRGEVTIVLEARTAFTRGRTRSTFRAIPDVPIADFRLNLAGGRDGILSPARRSLCARRQNAGVNMRGQNGKRRKLRLRVGTPCPRRR
jgi:hypothetical protein